MTTFQWIEEVEAALQRGLAERARPASRPRRAALNGTSGSRVSRFRTSSTPQKQPLAAYVADRRMTLGQPRQLLGEHVPHRGGVLDDRPPPERLDRREGDRARERVPAVGEPAAEEASP